MLRINLALAKILLFACTPLAAQEIGSGTAVYKTENLGISISINRIPAPLTRDNRNTNVYETSFPVDEFEIVFTSFIEKIDSGSAIRLIASGTEMSVMEQTRSSWTPVHEHDIYCYGCAMAEEDTSTFLWVNHNLIEPRRMHYWFYPHSAGLDRGMIASNGNLIRPIRNLWSELCLAGSDCVLGEGGRYVELFGVPAIYLYIYIDLNDDGLINSDEFEVIHIINPAYLNS